MIMEKEQIDTKSWAHLNSVASEIEGYDKYFFNRLYLKLNDEGFIIPSKVVYSEKLISVRMEQAKAKLSSLGVSDVHLNKMCVLSFLALCNVSPVTPWRNAKKVSMSMTKDIMKFVSDNYNLPYKSNTRESFRREGINLLLSYELIDLNPDNPHLGPNSPHTHYAIKEKIIAKIKA